MAKYSLQPGHNHDEVYAKIGESGVTDHGALTGLGDNDHPQYRLVADAIDHGALTGLSDNDHPQYDNHIVNVLALAPAQTDYYKFATLPATSPGTFDYLTIEGVGGGFAAVDKCHYLINFGRRAGFHADTSIDSFRSASVLFAAATIQAYQEADGTVSVYAVGIAGFYGRISVRLVDQTQVTIYKDPAGSTTVPTGTKIYDLAETQTDGTWLNWTPTLTATTTNPYLGSGTLLGRYVKVGQLVVASVFLLFASDSNAGKGVWEISFPIAPTQPLFIGGSWSINDTGTNNFSGSVRYGGSTRVSFPYEGSPFYVSHNYPMTWANGDSLRATWTYEAA